MSHEHEHLLDEAMVLVDKGKVQEAHSLVRQFFDKDGEIDRIEECMIKFHLVSAKIHTDMAQHLDAVQHAMTALMMAETLELKRYESDAMRMMGHIHWRKGDPNMALELHSEAMARAMEAEDNELQGIIHVEIGNVYMDIGKLDIGAQNYRKAIDLLEPSRNMAQLARAYNNLGDYDMSIGEWERALHRFKQVIDTDPDNPISIGWAQVNAGECMMFLGIYEEGLDAAEEGIAALEGVGEGYGLVLAHRAKGLLLCKLERWEDAEKVLQKGIELASNVGIPVSDGLILRAVGQMYMWKGDEAMARKYLEDAAGIFREHGIKEELRRVEGDLKELGA